MISWLILHFKHIHVQMPHNHIKRYRNKNISILIQKRSNFRFTYSFYPTSIHKLVLPARAERMKTIYKVLIISIFFLSYIYTKVEL